MDETDSEMQSMHTAIQNHLKDQAKADFPLLTYNPPALPDHANGRPSMEATSTKDAGD